MAKRISQETFDLAVKENIEEFQMTSEDAMADAIKQFESQGVNLSNIIKDLSIVDSNSTNGGDVSSSIGEKLGIVSAVDSLRTALSKDKGDPDTLLIISNCSFLGKICDVDLAHRGLVAKHGTYDVLLLAWRACCHSDDPKELTSTPSSHCDVMKVVLEALCSLCNGQPDLLEESGRKTALEVLRSSAADTAPAECAGGGENTSSSSFSDVAEDVLVLTARFVLRTCVMHENNRQAYVDDGLISVLGLVLDSRKSSAPVVREVCASMRALTIDDDVRVPFGRGHDHAKMIVAELGALKKLITLCNDFCNTKEVLAELFATLARLAVRNEFCSEIMDLGGIKIILGSLQSNMDHRVITKHALNVLKIIAGNDDVKQAIGSAGGVSLVLSAMEKRQRDAGICETGCALVAMLTLRQEANARLVMRSEGAEILLKAMQLHPDEAAVQTQGCIAIRNIVSRQQQYCFDFLALGAEETLRQALAKHPSCSDEVKAALRDLGLKVELKELWAGHGHELKQ